MSNEWESKNIFEVLGNAQARRILVLADMKPMSAQELADHCETSLPTIYRRINELVKHDLLRKREQRDSKNKHQIFTTNLEKVCFRVENGGFVVDIQLRQQMVDQFEDFWHELHESGSRSVNSDE